MDFINVFIFVSPPLECKLHESGHLDLFSTVAPAPRIVHLKKRKKQQPKSE